MKLPKGGLFRSNFITKALPFLIICIGGSFGLKGFTSLRYEYSQKSSVSQNELEKQGILRKPPSESTIEKQYEKMKDMDIDNWENIRGPREWEEGTIEKNKEKTKKIDQNV